MTLEELKSVTAPAILGRIGGIETIPEEVYQANFVRGLFATGGLWPKLKVIALWADMSPVPCPWAAKVLTDMMACPPVEGQRRDVQLVKLLEANHFVRVLYDL